MKTLKISGLILLELCFGETFPQQSIDAYVTDSTKNVFTLVAGSSNSLESPIDLDFYPDQITRPNELWILNQGTYSSGGSTLIISNANSSSRTFKYIKDGNAWHFMALASAIAFGESNWATSNDIIDANRQGGKYTGPTLWPGDLSIYGVVGNPPTSQYNGSHLDMIHQSPYGKGIAFEKDNFYWVLDGFDGTLKRYDFNSDHGPGQSYHGDGGVRVYSEFSFTRHVSLPGHIVIDSYNKYLYGCDPVGKRVFRIDITTGTQSGNAVKVNNETLTGGYYTYSGITKDDFLISGLGNPVGIDIYGDRLVVTDNSTDEIIIYNISNNFAEVGRIKLKYAASPDPMGIKVGPDGKIYFVDKTNKLVYMIENSSVFPLGINSADIPNNILKIYPNPGYAQISLELNEVLQNGVMDVVNVLGEIVLSQHFYNSEISGFDATKLEKGLYFIQVKDKHKIFIQKFIKQ